jgi:Domain of unknown function (DUF4388)/Type II secretion system (T2SS), protein G
MGLDGTLRAFKVTDILQMLGLQKKTGVLTIEGTNDQINVFLVGGSVVSADSDASSLDERIGNFLVRTGKLASGELLRALEMQKQTQETLGALLLKDRYVSTEDLREALRIQVVRILLPAFEWTDGKFRFNPSSAVRPDANLLALPVESLLTESARITAEWPSLQAKIPSRDVVFRRAPGVENLRLVLKSEEARDGALVVSRREAEAWKWVDGRRRVGEILDRAFLSDLETYRGLSELLDRNLIVADRLQTGTIAQPTLKAPWVSARALGLWAIFLLLSASAVLEVPRGKWNVFLRPLGERHEIADFLSSVSLARMVSIERAVRVYYDASGRYPHSLNDLVTAQVLDRGTTIDPYGRPYRYILRSADGKFSLYGWGADGAIDVGLSFERSLAPVSDAGSARRARPAERHPGVIVIQ